MQPSAVDQARDPGGLAVIAASLCADYNVQHSDLVYRAVGYVWPLHDQQSKWPSPFAVATELKALGVDSHTLVASLLGASVCEPSLTLEKIGEEFGHQIAVLVKSVRWLHTFREGEFIPAKQ